MCSRQGHLVRDCHKSKFFLSQGICHLDTNNRVVMSDGSPLPRADGEGGSARIIRERLAGPVRTSTSTANVEVESYQSEYDAESEFVTLGAMDFEVLPAERSDKSKRTKPYERAETKKPVTPKVVMENAPKPLVTPNRAYVEIPMPTIL